MINCSVNKKNLARQQPDEAITHANRAGELRVSHASRCDSTEPRRALPFTASHSGTGTTQILGDEMSTYTAPCNGFVRSATPYMAGAQ